MVSYRSTDGKQSYHQTDELGDAIKFVEHLRNDEAVDQARIFKLDEVSFEFRPYFRVELATAAPAMTMPAPADTDWLSPAPEAFAPEAPQQLEAMDDEEVDVDPLAAAWSASEPREPEVDDQSVGAGMGRRGLFGR